MAKKTLRNLMNESIQEITGISSELNGMTSISVPANTIFYGGEDSNFGVMISGTGSLPRGLTLAGLGWDANALDELSEEQTITETPYKFIENKSRLEEIE